MDQTIKLVDIPVIDENVALNLMVSFLNLAHKRGAFTIDESAKIWETIKIFQKPVADQPLPPVPEVDNESSSE